MSSSEWRDGTRPSKSGGLLSIDASRSLELHPSDRAPPSPERDVEGLPSRILIIEDSPSDTLLIQRELSCAVPSLACRFAVTVKDGLVLARQAPPELILLDLSLPDSQGLATLRHIRAELPGVPVVVLTGLNDIKLAVAALRSGARDYLAKDDLAALQSTVRRVLGEARAESEQREREVLLTCSSKQESVGRLAAGVAHEINTPLQIIGDNLVFLHRAFQLLLPGAPREASGATREGAQRDGLDGPLGRRTKLDYVVEQVPPAIAQALDGVQRVARVIATLNEHCGSPTAMHVPTDIRRVIEASLWRCREHWRPLADVRTEFGSDLPLVDANSDLVEAFVNLLVNATEAIARRGTTHRGTIHILTAQVGASLVVRIQDDGVGMTEQDQARAFDPFFTTKAVGQGTGQGLSVVHAVIAKHGGAVSVKAELDRGATFVVSLPVTSHVSQA